MARRKSLNPRSMTPARWRQPFWEDPMYPFYRRPANPDTTLMSTSSTPADTGFAKPPVRSIGQLKLRYRTPPPGFEE